MARIICYQNSWYDFAYFIINGISLKALKGNTVFKSYVFAKSYILHLSCDNFSPENIIK